MRTLTTNTKSLKSDCVVVDETLDAKYAGKILFPGKIEKAKQLLSNNRRFNKVKAK